ncbi:MAG: type II toxin-antitoxin system CcdA family antitoxin [Actinomycetota bacterium]
MPKVTVYLPDELAEEVRAAESDINISAACQEALKAELERHKRQRGLEDGMARIEVELPADKEGSSWYKGAFFGRWLVEPASDETRTTSPKQGWDAGAYWGIAITGKGRFVAYTAHCNERFLPSLVPYDTLDEMDDDVPEDILILARASLGEDVVVDLDY